MKKSILIELLFVGIALLSFLLKMYLFLGSWKVSGILLLALFTAFSSQLVNYFYFRKQLQFERYIKGFLGVGIVVFVSPFIMAFILILYTLYFTEQGPAFIYF